MAEVWGSRRAYLAAVAASVSVSGCLRLSDAEGTDGGPTSGPGGTADVGAGTDTSGLFPSREEAIAQAAEATFDVDVTPLGTPDVPAAEVLSYSDGSFGTVSTNGSNGGTSVSTDMRVTVADRDAIRLGAGTRWAVRVHNVTLGETATFRPASYDQPLDVTGMGLEQYLDSVETPELGPPALYTTDRDDPLRPEGAWERTGTVYGGQAFAQYRVVLLEEGTVVGRTGAGIHASGYLWVAQQTADSLFVTRQPSVQSDWFVGFEYGGGERTVPAASRPDRGVFEVDLTQLSADPGQYNWSLVVKRDRTAGLDGTYLRLRGSGLILR